MEVVKERGIREAEQNGIIFIDEIDKIVGSGASHGPDVSREGVQRDILPIVEGCTVNTKYGPIQTDYILFVGAGAFHVSKVEDMIPELQGRFPVSVSLDSLSEDDFVQILKSTDNSVIKQYQALLKTEDVNLIFGEGTLEAIAKIAFIKNEEEENIGARRLHTVLEKLLEEISFYASDYEQEDFLIDVDYVNNQFKLSDSRKNYDRYLL
jgi:ATP-dependent HslUV protease ATP-binding subunit HslU